MSRPGKLTQERQDRICGMLRNGIAQDAAALANGITPRTLHNWKARGQDALDAAADDDAADASLPEDDQPYVQFLRAVEKARGEAEAAMTMLVSRAAQSDPKWAAWWLDRAHPERWAQRQQVTVAQEGEVRIRLEGV